MLCWLSPLTELSRSCAAGRTEGLLEGPRDSEDAWVEGFAEPFMVYAIEGREALGGGTIEVRFVGGSMDFRDVVAAALVPGVDPLERVDDPICLVGDFCGDWIS